MKKTLLLAGVACLFSAAVQAQEFRPYVGLDYAYDKADFKKDAKNMDDGFNSGIINVGTRMGDYLGLEAFYQQAGERKSHRPDGIEKFKFHAYGIDVYGYMPIDTAQKFDLLASLGIADYETDHKKIDGKTSKGKIGYRAGIGAQYNFTDHFAARVMARYNYVGMAHLNNFNEVTAGVRYTF